MKKYSIYRKRNGDRHWELVSYFYSGKEVVTHMMDFLCSKYGVQYEFARNWANDFAEWRHSSYDIFEYKLEIEEEA